MSNQNESKRLAGAFALVAMKGYVDEIRMASYPHTPEQVGGELYIYFKAACDEIEALGRRNASSLMIADTAIDRFNTFLRAVGEDQVSAYDHRAFQEKTRILERILAGEEPRAILADIRMPA